MINNHFAGLAGQPDGRQAAYAQEPFCNFRFHNSSGQSALVARNVVDQRVAVSAGIGGVAPLYNNGSVDIYDTFAHMLANMSFVRNVYAAQPPAAIPANFPNGTTLDEWKAKTGQDLQSVEVSDPGYAAGADARAALGERRDYRLDPAAPPLQAAGFAPLLLDNVGPVEQLPWATCNNHGTVDGVWWRGCNLTLEGVLGGVLRVD